MASASVTSTDAGRGKTRSLQTQGPRFAARRLAFVLAFVALLVIIAGVANYGPLSHYLSARERLQEATAQVAALQEQNEQMQAQIGKLNQSGYLEDLARQQLTYALPNEELYVLAEDAVGDRVFGANGLSTDSVASEAAGSEPAEASAREPGFFEHLLLTIASVF